MVKILGIDPGLRMVGYSLVQLGENTFEPTLLEAGVLKLDAKQSIDARLVQLYDDLCELIDEHQPDTLAVEKLFAHYKHPRTAILMAHARGVILLAAQQRGMSIAHLSATAVKKAITGHGHATKEQMQLAVQSQCKLDAPPTPHDVADAIAIALTHGRRLAIDRL